MEAPDSHRTIEAVWRQESPRLIAGLARILRDVGRAEDLAQDALVAALVQWPQSGIPENPGAWLMTSAKRRAIDALRHDRMRQRKQPEIARALGEDDTPDSDAALDDDIGDSMLRLIFTACHPILPPEARVAMTLRLVGGLTVDEIARACLVPTATVAQRILRAKRTISDAAIPYEVPRGPELRQRLESVLAVVYLIFNEGYSATAGEEWFRPPLCAEAIRLGSILAEIVPADPEVSGLVALMELQASRLRARVNAQGEPILLPDQDRTRWDRAGIERGLSFLHRAASLGREPGPYQLQARIAACHARAARAEETDWAQIAALYEVLGRLTPSPVIELNRAVAVCMASGPAAGLAILDRLGAAPALKDYHLLPSVRGDFLFRLGRMAEARAEFERAAGMTENARERELLRRRAGDCEQNQPASQPRPQDRAP